MIECFFSNLVVLTQSQTTGKSSLLFAVNLKFPVISAVKTPLADCKVYLTFCSEMTLASSYPL